MASDSFDDFEDFDFDEIWDADTSVLDSQPQQTPDISTMPLNLKRRAMVVVFIVDTSGSMRGPRIGAVNDAIRNLLPELRRKEHKNTAAEIKVAVLTFASQAHWLMEEPQPVSQYQFEDITNVSGGTNYSNAYIALNEKLTPQAFMKSSAGSYTPLLVMMSDGKPSDAGLYKEELERLRQNKWFRHATRAGIIIDAGRETEQCRAALTEFTGNASNVYEAKNTAVLARQIKLVTQTGVDQVTHQGSIESSAHGDGSLSSLSSQVSSGQSSSSSSVTLDLDDFDLDDFD